MSARLATMTDAEFAAEMAALDEAIARIRKQNRRVSRLLRRVAAEQQKERAA